MPLRFLNYLLQLLRDEIFHHTVYNSHAKSWGSNPGTSQSDNSAIYQDATLKFDMRPSLFLMYFFFLWPKEKHDFWKVDRILRIKRNFKTKFGLLFCVYFDWLARTDIKNTKISKNGEKKNLFAYGTLYSQAVTHPSSNHARCCLTSVIGRELVFSTWYGRRHYLEFCSHHILNLNFSPISPRVLCLFYTLRLILVVFICIYVVLFF